MNKLEQAARQALEALEVYEIKLNSRLCNEAITALREALAEQAEQEPVYWEVRNGVCKHGVYRTKEHAEEVRFDMQKSHDLSGSLAAFNVRPLYAAPVRTKDLTDDDLEKTYDEICRNASSSERLLFRFARAVIAADREKNK